MIEKNDRTLKVIETLIPYASTIVQFFLQSQVPLYTVFEQQAKKKVKPVFSLLDELAQEDLNDYEGDNSISSSEVDFFKNFITYLGNYLKRENRLNLLPFDAEWKEQKSQFWKGYQALSDTTKQQLLGNTILVQIQVIALLMTDKSRYWDMSLLDISEWHKADKSIHRYLCIIYNWYFKEDFKAHGSSQQDTSNQNDTTQKYQRNILYSMIIAIHGLPKVYTLKQYGNKGILAEELFRYVSFKLLPINKLSRYFNLENKLIEFFGYFADEHQNDKYYNEVCFENANFRNFGLAIIEYTSRHINIGKFEDSAFFVGLAQWLITFKRMQFRSPQELLSTQQLAIIAEQLQAHLKRQMLHQFLNALTVEQNIHTLQSDDPLNLFYDALDQTHAFLLEHQVSGIETYRNVSRVNWASEMKKQVSQSLALMVTACATKPSLLATCKEHFEWLKSYLPPDELKRFYIQFNKSELLALKACTLLATKIKNNYLDNQTLTHSVELSKPDSSSSIRSQYNGLYPFLVHLETYYYLYRNKPDQLAEQNLIPKIKEFFTAFLSNPPASPLPEDVIACLYAAILLVDDATFINQLALPQPFVSSWETGTLSVFQYLIQNFERSSLQSIKQVTPQMCSKHSGLYSLIRFVELATLYINQSEQAVSAVLERWMVRTKPGFSISEYLKQQGAFAQQLSSNVVIKKLAQQCQSYAQTSSMKTTLNITATDFKPRVLNQPLLKVKSLEPEQTSSLKNILSVQAEEFKPRVLNQQSLFAPSKPFEINRPAIKNPITKQLEFKMVEPHDKSSITAPLLQPSNAEFFALENIAPDVLAITNFLFYKLQEIKIYLVGGAVRNLIKGEKPHDFDFVVINASLIELKKALKHHYLVKNCNIIGTLHPVLYVTLTSGLELDLKSLSPKCLDEKQTLSLLNNDYLQRDFTINAIYIELFQNNKRGVIFSFQNAREDLRRNRLTTVQKNPMDSFKTLTRIPRLVHIYINYPQYIPSPKLIEAIAQLSQQWPVLIEDYLKAVHGNIDRLRTAWDKLFQRNELDTINVALSKLGLLGTLSGFDLDEAQEICSSIPEDINKEERLIQWIVTLSYARGSLIPMCQWTRFIKYEHGLIDDLKQELHEATMDDSEGEYIDSTSIPTQTNLETKNRESKQHIQKTNTTYEVSYFKEIAQILENHYSKYLPNSVVLKCIDETQQWCTLQLEGYEEQRSDYMQILHSKILSALAPHPWRGIVDKKIYKSELFLQLITQQQHDEHLSILFNAIPENSYQSQGCVELGFIGTLEFMTQATQLLENENLIIKKHMPVKSKIIAGNETVTNKKALSVRPTFEVLDIPKPYQKWFAVYTSQVNDLLGSVQLVLRYEIWNLKGAALDLPEARMKFYKFMNTFKVETVSVRIPPSSIPWFKNTYLDRHPASSVTKTYSEGKLDMSKMNYSINLTGPSEEVFKESEFFKKFNHCATVKIDILGKFDIEKDIPKDMRSFIEIYQPTLAQYFFVSGFHSEIVEQRANDITALMKGTEKTLLKDIPNIIDHILKHSQLTDRWIDLGCTVSFKPNNVRIVGKPDKVLVVGQLFDEEVSRIYREELQIKKIKMSKAFSYMLTHALKKPMKQIEVTYKVEIDGLIGTPWKTIATARHKTEKKKDTLIRLMIGDISTNATNWVICPHDINTLNQHNEWFGEAFCITRKLPLEVQKDLAKQLHEIKNKETVMQHTLSIGMLRTKNLVHCLYDSKKPSTIKDALQNALSEIIKQQDVNTISIPAIGVNGVHFKYLEDITFCITTWLESNTHDSLKEIQLINYDAKTVLEWSNCMKSIVSGKPRPAYIENEKTYYPQKVDLNDHLWCYEVNGQLKPFQPLIQNKIQHYMPYLDTCECWVPLNGQYIRFSPQQFKQVPMKEFKETYDWNDYNNELLSPYEFEIELVGQNIDEATKAFELLREQSKAQFAIDSSFDLSQLTTFLEENELVVERKDDQFIVTGYQRNIDNFKLEWLNNWETRQFRV